MARSRYASQVSSCALICCAGLLLASACRLPWTSKRSEPACAVQDCKTGKILDDGCSADGRCKSCINDCGERVAPKTAR